MVKYVTIWKVRPEHIKAAIARFKETGGAPRSDILEFDTFVVVDDEEAAKVLFA